MAGIDSFFEVDEDGNAVEPDSGIDPSAGSDSEEETKTTEETSTEEKEETETDTEVKKEEETGKEDSAEGEGGADGKEEEEESEDEGDGLQETISSLRQMIREQAQEIKNLQDQSQRLATTLTEAGTIDEESLEPSGEDSVFSPERQEALSLLAETMRVNPSFSDFNDICSQENFDLTVDTLARLAVEEEGGTLTEKVQEVNDYVWSLANPYKFVYDVVKANHPKYNASTEEQPPKEKEKVKAPTSVSTIAGGGGSGNEGWTAAKIDALPEDQLHTVPNSVYEKYMMNDLK